MLMLLGREGWDISGVIFFPQHLQLSNGSSKAKQNTAKKIASLGAGWREHEYKQGCWWQDVNIKDECTEAEGIQMFTELLTSLLKPTPDFWEARQWYVCMEHCSTDRCLPVLLSKCSQLRERSPGEQSLGVFCEFSELLIFLCPLLPSTPQQMWLDGMLLPNPEFCFVKAEAQSLLPEELSPDPNDGGWVTDHNLGATWCLLYETCHYSTWQGAGSWHSGQALVFCVSGSLWVVSTLNTLGEKKNPN